MGIAQDGLMMVRAQLCGRIEDVESELEALTPAQLAGRIDDIRSLARTHGLVPLEALAHSLESALSAMQSCLGARHYLDMMRDAAGCERADADAAAVYLAMIGQRRFG